MLVTVLATIAIAGCQTTRVPPLAGQPSAAQDANATITLLSNEVLRLNQRVQALENELSEIRLLFPFMRDLIEEMRYEPIVNESLLGITDNGDSVMTNELQAIGNSK